MMNVLAAVAVINLVGREGWIIWLTLGPMLFYAVAAGVIGLGMARFKGPRMDSQQSCCSVKT